MAALAALPRAGVFCLPYMYADYVCYNSGQPILWGGHCGDLRRLEALAPVIRRPLPDLFTENGVGYVLLDHLYARPSDIQLEGAVTTRGRWGTFELYDVSRAARTSG